MVGNVLRHEEWGCRYPVVEQQPCKSGFQAIEEIVCRLFGWKARALEYVMVPVKGQRMNNAIDG